MGAGRRFEEMKVFIEVLEGRRRGQKMVLGHLDGVSRNESVY